MSLADSLRAMNQILHFRIFTLIKLPISLLLLGFLTSVLDALGVASILPVILVIKNPDILIDFLLRFGVEVPQDEIEKVLIFLIVFFILVLMVSTYLRFSFAVRNFHFFKVSEVKISSYFLRNFISLPGISMSATEGMDLIKRLFHDTNIFCSHILSQTVTLFQSSVTLVLLLGVMLYADWQNSLFAISVLLLSYLAFWISISERLGVFSRRISWRIGERFKLAKMVSDHAAEFLVFSRKGYVSESYERLGSALCEDETKVFSWHLSPRYFFEILGLGLVLLLIGVSQFDGRGLIGVAEIIAFMAVAGYRLLPVVQSIYNSISYFKNGIPSLRHLEELLKGIKSYQSDLTERFEAPAFGCEDLCVKTRFSDGSHRLLFRIGRFEFPHGKKILISGESGVGKSSFFKALLKIHPFASGTIMYPHDHKHHDKSIGYAPQDPFILNDSLAFNVAFENCRDPRVLEILISLGFKENWVEAHSDESSESIRMKLSGGEKQRVGIARALFQAPQILLLDEVTSGLDGDNFKKVMSAIDVFGRHSTVIFISHDYRIRHHIDVEIKFEDLIE